MTTPVRIPEASMPWIAALVGAGGPLALSNPYGAIFVRPGLILRFDEWILWLLMAPQGALLIVTSFAIGWWLASQKMVVWAMRGYVLLVFIPALVVRAVSIPVYAREFEMSGADWSSGGSFWGTLIQPALIVAGSSALQAITVCGLIYAGSRWRRRQSASASPSAGEAAQ
jgi:hypothetical protein